MQEREVQSDNVRQPEGGNTLPREILCIAGASWLEGINQKGGKSHANSPLLALNKYQIELGKLWTGLPKSDQLFRKAGHSGWPFLHDPACDPGCLKCALASDCQHGHWIRCCCRGMLVTEGTAQWVTRVCCASWNHQQQWQTKKAEICCTSACLKSTLYQQHWVHNSCNICSVTKL